MVLVENDPRPLPLADAAEGLLAPQAGCVRFLGQDWTGMSPDEAVAARASIGRVFSGPAWISNLDVDENVVLRLRHHTGRTPEDIEAEACALARAVGLEDLPRRRPAWVNRQDLARAQWVRALLGQPAMLLLERPKQDVPEDAVAALAAAVQEARGNGTAIVWFTSSPKLWNDKGLGATRRCEMRGAKLVSAGENTV